MDCITAEQAVIYVAAGECQWNKMKTYTDGKVERAQEFNILRGEKLDTTLNEGDSWMGNPERPLTMGESILDMLAGQEVRVVVSGDDLVSRDLILFKCSIKIT